MTGGAAYGTPKNASTGDSADTTVEDGVCGDLIGIMTPLSVPYLVWTCLGLSGRSCMSKDSTGSVKQIIIVKDSIAIELIIISAMDFTYSVLWFSVISQAFPQMSSLRLYAPEVWHHFALREYLCHRLRVSQRNGIVFIEDLWQRIKS